MKRQPSTISKRHYKMYKAGKIWVVAGIATTVLVLHPSVSQADSNAPQTDETAVQAGTTTQSSETGLRTSTAQPESTPTPATQPDHSADGSTDNITTNQDQALTTVSTTTDQVTPTAQDQSPAPVPTDDLVSTNNDSSAVTPAPVVSASQPVTKASLATSGQSAQDATATTQLRTAAPTTTPTTTVVPTTTQPTSSTSTTSQGTAHAEQPASTGSGSATQPTAASQNTAVTAATASTTSVATTATQSIGQIENDANLAAWLEQYYGWSGTVSDYIQANPLGVASLFHVFSLAATLNAHTQGNVATISLSGNSDFATVNSTELPYDYSYVQDFLAGTGALQSAFETSSQRINKLFVGQNVTVSPLAGNRVDLFNSTGNRVTADHLSAADVVRDTDGQYYIDMDAAFAQLRAVSTRFAQTGTTTITNGDFSDNNKRIIDMKAYASQINDRQEIVINLSANVMTQPTQLILQNYDYYFMDPTLPDVTFVFNVDTGSQSAYAVQTQVMLWLGDTESTVVNFQASSDFYDNHLIWNFTHNDPSTDTATYEITTGGKMYGSLLAVDGNVTLKPNVNVDGNLVSTQVIVAGETHRWDLQTPKTPDDPVGPVDPEGPEGPETPVTPGGPETPVTPEGPETPVTPGGPETPITPEGPETPITPTSPETPVTPPTPTPPETPIDPPTPQAPEEPFTPAPEPQNPVAPPRESDTGQTPRTVSTPRARRVILPRVQQGQSAAQPANQAQTKLPQTSETHSNIFAVLGFMALGLLTSSGIWLKRKFD